MQIPSDFLSTLEYADIGVYLDSLRCSSRPCGGQIWTVLNEIRPIDLYCYLFARFGAPNGIHSLVRNNDSDNMIHWDWTLSCTYGWVTFMGMSFRTEIHFLGGFPFDESDKADFLSNIKEDFANYRAPMSQIRNNQLEKWVEFINPYQRLKQAIYQLLDELRALALDVENDVIPDMLHEIDRDSQIDQWNTLGRRYSKGLGLCFGIRAMLPVMAEAFVNMLIYMLMKPEVKRDKRLREHAFRDHIDIRIRSLNLNCIGFKVNVDYTNQACKDFHSFIDNRNDLLHGNIDIDRLKFSNVFFQGTVPIFEEYRSMWQRSIGVGVQASGLEELDDEVKVVDNFTQYILSCLDINVRKEVEMILEKRDLGYMPKKQRLGILFPDHLVDWKVVDAPKP